MLETNTKFGKSSSAPYPSFLSDLKYYQCLIRNWEKKNRRSVPTRLMQMYNFWRFYILVWTDLKHSLSPSFRILKGTGGPESKHDLFNSRCFIATRWSNAITRYFKRKTAHSKKKSQLVKNTWVYSSFPLHFYIKRRDYRSVPKLRN